MLKFLTKMLSDEKGEPSSMRVCLFLVIVVFLFNWTAACFGFATWHPIDLGSAVAVGAAFGAKAASNP